MNIIEVSVKSKSLINDTRVRVWVICQVWSRVTGFVHLKSGVTKTLNDHFICVSHHKRCKVEENCEWTFRAAY